VVFSLALLVFFNETGQRLTCCHCRWIWVLSPRYSFYQQQQ